MPDVIVAVAVVEGIVVTVVDIGDVVGDVVVIVVGDVAVLVVAFVVTEVVGVVDIAIDVDGAGVGVVDVVGVVGQMAVG